MHGGIQRLKKGYLQDKSGVGSDAVMVGKDRKDGHIRNTVKHHATSQAQHRQKIQVPP